MNNGTIDRLQEMLSLLATQAQRLADGASDLAEVAGQMEARLAEVARAVRERPAAVPVAQRPAVEEPAAPAPANVDEQEPVLEPDEPAAAETVAAGDETHVLEPEGPSDPQFVPSDPPLSVALAGVPGFQGLMDAQRALSGMAQAESASVIAFKNGEAVLQVVLHGAVTAREIVEGVRDGTGEQLLIEESRPEAGKLRLRFVTR